jgi:hypothetical protein
VEVQTTLWFVALAAEEWFEFPPTMMVSVGQLEDATMLDGLTSFFFISDLASMSFS